MASLTFEGTMSHRCPLLTYDQRMTVSVDDIYLTPAIGEASPQLRGILAVPEGEGPWPGVVMVHEVFGIDESMRAAAKRLAEAGFIALMPDLFSMGGARRCLTRTFRDLTAGTGRAFADIEAARLALIARDDCTGRIGVIGFCMGGGFALVTAAGHGFDASSVNYGRLPKDLEHTIEGACPIVGSYGARDKSLKGAAVKLESALATAEIPHDVKEYPDAGHAFLNSAPAGNAVTRALMKRILGLGPEPEAAADAWGRIDAFFGEHLR
jgi:carboxymethylenebutenolidase